MGADLQPITEAVEVAEYDTMTLDQLEAVIARGKTAEADTYRGYLALAVIQRDKKWRHTHTSFDDYCLRKLGLSHSTAARWLKAGRWLLAEVGQHPARTDLEAAGRSLPQGTLAGRKKPHEDKTAGQVVPRRDPDKTPPNSPGAPIDAASRPLDPAPGDGVPPGYDPDEPWLHTHGEREHEHFGVPSHSHPGTPWIEPAAPPAQASEWAAAPEPTPLLDRAGVTAPSPEPLEAPAPPTPQAQLAHLLDHLQDCDPEEMRQIATNDQMQLVQRWVERFLDRDIPMLLLAPQHQAPRRPALSLRPEPSEPDRLAKIPRCEHPRSAVSPAKTKGKGFCSLCKTEVAWGAVSA